MYSVAVSVWHRVSTPYCSIVVFGDFFFAILRYLANFSAVLWCSEPPNVPLSGQSFVAYNRNLPQTTLLKILMVHVER